MISLGFLSHSFSLFNPLFPLFPIVLTVPAVSHLLPCRAGSSRTKVVFILSVFAYDTFHPMVLLDSPYCFLIFPLCNVFIIPVLDFIANPVIGEFSFTKCLFHYQPFQLFKAKFKETPEESAYSVN